MNTRADDPRIAELEKKLSDTKARLSLSVDCAKTLTAENSRLHNNMNKMSEAISDSDDEITLLKEENARLRDAGEKMAEALKLEDHILMMAMLFKGYEGGPLDEPSSTMARYGADTALTAWNEVTK